MGFNSAFQYFAVFTTCMIRTAMLTDFDQILNVNILSQNPGLHYLLHLCVTLVIAVVSVKIKPLDFLADIACL